MSRTTGSSGQATFEAIRKTGLRLIYVHGYEAMSLRQLASEVGLTPGSLYNHIATKQDLLFRLVSDHMADVLLGVQAALKGKQSPSERLVAFVEFHVTYHIDRKMEVFISYSELRSLDPNNFRSIIAMRRAYEKTLIDILEDGASNGDFAIVDSKTSAFGLLSMLSGICTWYNPTGRLTPQELIDVYTAMVNGSVGQSFRSADKVNLRRT